MKNVYLQQTRESYRDVVVSVPDWVDVNELDPKTIRDLIDIHGGDEWLSSGWEAQASETTDEAKAVATWPFDTEDAQMIFGGAR